MPVSQFPHLLSPLMIGNTEVRNRILVSAHVPGFAENNKPGEKYTAYHRNYAHHGVGLQITGGTPVHESGLLGTSSDALWNLDDDVIAGYQMLSDAVHAEGGCILAQLAHSAGTVLINQPGRASWSASAIRSETTGNISHAMSQAEMLGSLEVGKLADLIVVDRDVVALAESGRAHEISETRVLLTLFDGKVVFEEEPLEISSK